MLNLLQLVSSLVKVQQDQCAVLKFAELHETIHTNCNFPKRAIQNIKEIIETKGHIYLLNAQIFVVDIQT